MPDSFARVSVVIPTVGRDSLSAAVGSALSQSHRPVQVIVVFDGPAEKAPLHVLKLDPSVSIVSTGGGAGPNVARNRGITAAIGDYVALLDDDDEWLPGKLEAQIALAAKEPDGRWVCATAVITRGGVTGQKWPSRGPRQGQAVADYLFVRSIRARHPFLQTSSWMIPRELLLEIPMREDLHLSLMDDFDWLIRSQVESGVRVLFVPEALTVYTVMNSDSFGVRSRWQDCLGWISDPTLPVRGRARADFILGIPFRLALAREGRRVAASLVPTAFKAGRPTLMALSIVCLKLISGAR